MVMDKIKQHRSKLVTLSVVAIALLCAWLLYCRYQAQPWTRDGQVRAHVVKIVPRVSGYLVEVAISDNEEVKKGQLLFRIDPIPYQLAVEQAEVQLDQAHEQVTALEAAVSAAEATVKQRNATVDSSNSQIAEAKAGVASADAALQEAESGLVSARALIAQYTAQLEEAKREAARAKRLADTKAGSVETAESKAAAVDATEAQLDSAKAGLQQAQAAIEKAKAGQAEAQAKLDTAKNGLAESQAAVQTALADLDQAKANLGEPGDANVRIRNAQVQLDEAELNLSWTEISAPADGYVTNMNLTKDTYVAPGTPFAAFVDASSFRVDAYFQETKLKKIRPGDSAVVTLMGHHGEPLDAVVDSIGYAITPPDLAQTEGPEYVVPSIQPSFDWIRLAQRVPVRIRFTEVPKDLHLVSGTTASVSIRK
jgi:multidrug resistance efflux pump